MSTSLSRYAKSWQDPDPKGPARAAREAWIEHGILVVMPEQVHGLDREFVRALGNRLWGKGK